MSTTANPKCDQRVCSRVSCSADWVSWAPRSDTYTCRSWHYHDETVQMVQMSIKDHSVVNTVFGKIIWAKISLLQNVQRTNRTDKYDTSSDFIKKTQLIFVDPRRNLERAYPKYLKVLWGKERPWESIVFFKFLNPLVLLSFLQEHKQF